MTLSQDQLAAFAAIARTGSFTRAARALHLSQPALSRRITNLEEALAMVLVVRSRTGATLTDAGRRVLGFVEAQRALEDELLGELSPTTPAFRGVVRVAGVSSLVPPVVLPALAPFLREHPAVQIEIHREVEGRLADDLVAGRVDFAIAQVAAQTPNIVEIPLGDEEFVLIESRRFAGRRDVFLDVSPEDTTTAWFLAAQPARQRPREPWTRSYLFDEPGILLAVELGLGRAVKPRHTIPRGAAVRVDAGFRALTRPVYLQHRRQRFHSRLHATIRELVETAVRAYLLRSGR
jgi:DNA-binding transcriptional LysR family regulator